MVFHMVNPYSWLVTTVTVYSFYKDSARKITRRAEPGGGGGPNPYKPCGTKNHLLFAPGTVACSVARALNGSGPAPGEKFLPASGRRDKGHPGTAGGPVDE